MTIVVGFVPTPEGEAALSAAITEAQRRGGETERPGKMAATLDVHGDEE